MKQERSTHPFLFFSAQEKQKIVQAIRAAERVTSGEIRVHVDGGHKKDLMDRAREIFERTGMACCRERNGVLIFFAPAQRGFSLLADQGIHAKVPPGFWDEIAALMQAAFAQDRFADGICQAIERAGTKLAQYFPPGMRNPNELPDEISFSH